MLKTSLFGIGGIRDDRWGGGLFKDMKIEQLREGVKVR